MWLSVRSLITLPFVRTFLVWASPLIVGVVVQVMCVPTSGGVSLGTEGVNSALVRVLSPTCVLLGRIFLVEPTRLWMLLHLLGDIIGVRCSHRLACYPKPWHCCCVSLQVAKALLQWRVVLLRLYIGTLDVPQVFFFNVRPCLCACWSLAFLGESLFWRQFSYSFALQFCMPDFSLGVSVFLFPPLFSLSQLLGLPVHRYFDN